ncbi:MAG TPA: 2-C-methyl-D-erythritol 4-phosphate cytidylyltransferase [Pseudonocardiaceae bacterium]|jgi:2-C-methyl-D-erythritol 4-phosphate cytidylyltransferase|nr:2-C-methyl-D-erythritol 4-phosphate cytidylyltransferase [Pseudonocardiaceae bacterium]
MTVVALVPVTGRTGQFGDILDSLLESVLNNLLAADCVDLACVVVPPSEVDTVEKTITSFVEKPIHVIGVEKSAFESMNSIVASALPAIRSLVSTAEVSTVLVHGPRHAYAPPELIRQVVAEIQAGAPSVVPVLPCTDTVKELDATGVIIDTPNRATLRVTQSPIGFAARLWPVEQPWAELPPGTRTIPGHPAARAIRTSFDLAFARDSAKEPR